LGLGLGFDMKNILTTLSAVLVLGLNISCLKKQNLEEQNLGPVVSATEVQQKMGEAIGVLDFGTLKIGESNSVLSSVTLEDSQNIKIFKQDITVLRITNTQAEFSFDYSQKVENFLRPDLNFDTLKTPKNFNLEKPKESNPSNMAIDDPLLLPLVFVNTSQYCGIDKISCHNFTVTPIRISLNPTFTDPRICPNVNTCEISARKIEFDLLNGQSLNDQGKPSLNRFTIIVAGQLPFLSKVLQYCSRGLMNYGNRKVVAENCKFVTQINSGN
jgi:hypothetical protein